MEHRIGLQRPVIGRSDLNFVGKIWLTKRIPSEDETYIQIRNESISLVNEMQTSEGHV